MKTQQLYSTLQKALARFKETSFFPDTDPMKESTIQRFEYTFELSWKLMNSILKDQGIDTYGVKNIIREAFKLKLIENIEIWLEYANARNLTSHLYQEGVVNKIYELIKKDFANHVESLVENSTQYAGSTLQ